MVRPPSFDRNGMKKGAWSEDEDNKLRAYVERYGHRNWRLIPIFAGLARCGKSCRLRWVNYLRPGLKRGNFTKHEEDIIIKLHAKRGNKWSAIAVELPGRTDNEIKNYWHAHIMKRGKRKGAAVVKEQSSESNLCMTTDHDHQQEGLFAKNLENVDAFDFVGQGHDHQGDIFAREAHQTCFTQLDADLLPTAAELHDFGLLQVMQNYVSNCFDYSSDAGINSGAGSQGSFSSKAYGEDAFYDDLWS